VLHDWIMGRFVKSVEKIEEIISRLTLYVDLHDRWWGLKTIRSLERTPEALGGTSDLIIELFLRFAIWWLSHFF